MIFFLSFWIQPMHQNETGRQPCLHTATLVLVCQKRRWGSWQHLLSVEKDVYTASAPPRWSLSSRLPIGWMWGGSNPVLDCHDVSETSKQAFSAIVGNLKFTPDKSICWKLCDAMEKITESKIMSKTFYLYKAAGAAQQRRADLQVQTYCTWWS